jgi:nitrogen-specific signal transduction histidine kinase
MAAGLAHEIRNPLGAIKASAQFLSEPGGESASGQSREFLDIIVEEVDRLNRVVSSFLDYARPGAAPPAEAVDVNATVHRTLLFVAPELTPGIEVEEELAPDLPRVRIDPERLRQVLLNLAQNAAQAMEGKGRLAMRTRVVPGQTGEGARRAVEVQVQDTGPGIPERIQRSLFVPFVTTKERGTGLGLAISQRIVMAAGGTITARSTPGGATFVVRLPAADPPLAEAPRAAE